MSVVIGGDARHGSTLPCVGRLDGPDLLARASEPAGIIRMPTVEDLTLGLAAVATGVNANAAAQRTGQPAPPVAAARSVTPP